MGVDPVSIVVGIGMMVLSYALSYFVFDKKVESNINPSTIDDFSITRASEGTVIPVVLGTVKISGNILHFGNLQVVEQETSSGGKGGGDDVTTGYHNYLDVWQSVCIGPAKILKVYKDNKPWINSEISTQWSGVMADEGDGKKTTYITVNKGDGENNFTVPVEYYSPVKKVCTIWMQSVWCGNSNSLPVFHWVVKSQHSTPYADFSSGMSPSAVVWVILTGAGAAASSIDTASFTAAHNFWSSKNYGLNMIIGSQGKVRDQVKAILSPIGGYYFENEGKHYLLPNNPYAASSATITDEFVKFTIARRSWEDTTNDLKATFVDASQDYTQRTAVIQNSASVNLMGNVYTKTVDLNCFNSLSVVQRRLTEIIKSESYPYAEIEFSTSLKYANIQEGSIIIINNSKYGIENASYRVSLKDLENIDQNEVSFQAFQVVETLFDENYESIGTGSNTWTREVVAPIALTKTRILETPRNPLTDSPGIMVLAARQSGYETEFLLYRSPDNANFSYLKKFSSFNMYGTLKTTYPSTTYEIDDEVGVTVNLFKTTYVIDSLTRSGLFSTNRFLIIDNEIMKFQTVVVNGDGSVTFMGVIRGTMFTSKVAHSANAGVWIVANPECVFFPTNEMIGGYYRIIPRNLVGALPISGVSSITVAESTLARNPIGISRVFAARVGSSVSFIVSIKDTSSLGAGISGSNVFSVNSDSDAMIEYKLSTDSVWTRLAAGTGSFIIVNAASITVNVRYIEFGKYSSTVNLTVGATDGNYTV